MKNSPVYRLQEDCNPKRAPVLETAGRQRQPVYEKLRKQLRMVDTLAAG